ncbi:MAG: hypothetical protein WD468_00860 [Pirellulales bacterium]
MLKKTATPSPCEQTAAPALRPRLALAGTLALHDELAARLAQDPYSVIQALSAESGALRAKDRSFGGLKVLPLALSALLVDRDDRALLQTTAERLFILVERAIDWLLASPDRLARHAGDFRRMFPFLHKARGCAHAQFVSRYDAVVTPDGALKIIELNTGCPAGFMHADSFTRATSGALAALGINPPAPSGNGDARRGYRSRTIAPQALVEGLLALEQQSGLRPGLVALLTDENQLTHELDLMVESFTNHDRPSAILDVRELTFRHGRLAWRDHGISLSYDKFRISVPTSRNHCWREGFETRYADFLAAARAGSFVAVNSLIAQTIGEDKSLLGLLRSDEIAHLFDAAEREFLAQHILWTHRLEDTTVDYEGESIDLVPYVRAHREQFVIKPCHEGRGFEVVIGREATADQWNRLCAVDPATPRVVQQYVEPLQLPVVCEIPGGAAVREMYLTLGLATVGGRYRGVLSRVSPSRVTNVAREGMVQAVLATSE